MSSNALVARPYAKAAFAFALEHQTSAQWREALVALNEACQHDSLNSLLEDPRIDSELIGNSMIKSLEKNGFDQAQINFVKLLAKNKRLNVISDILQSFNALLDAHEQRLNCRIISAVPLSQEQQQTLSKQLTKRYETPVITTFEVDESLIGGLRIELNDKVIDSTLLRRIKQLETEILQ